MGMDYYEAITDGKAEAIAAKTAQDAARTMRSSTNE